MADSKLSSRADIPSADLSRNSNLHEASFKDPATGAALVHGLIDDLVCDLKITEGLMCAAFDVFCENADVRESTNRMVRDFLKAAIDRMEDVRTRLALQNAANQLCASLKSVEAAEAQQ